MKRVKSILSLLALLMIAVMLTGCLSIDIKVNKNGSLDMTYTINTSQTESLMPADDIEKAIKESVDDMNGKAKKKIVKLKDIKQDKKKKTITAKLTVSDINQMGDGSFFGTVKEYRKNGGAGLNNLVNAKGKEVEADKISDNMQVVYLPMGAADGYSMIEVTMSVPGSIQYITDGGEIDKKDTAVFNSQNPLVIFKKSGGFPFWLLIIFAAAVVFFMMKKKSPATAPINAASASVQGPPQNQPSQESPLQTSGIPNDELSPVVEAPADTVSDSEDKPIQ